MGPKFISCGCSSSDTAIPSDAETENDDGNTTLVVQNFRDIEFESELDDSDYNDGELGPSNPSSDLESEGELETEHRQNTSTREHTYHTQASSPETFDDVHHIADVYRDMATMQDVHDDRKSRDEMQQELVALRKHIHGLCDALEVQNSLTQAANSHCTTRIMKRAVGDPSLQTQLSNVKKQKTRGSTKVKARFLTLPELKAAFQVEVEEAERAEQRRIATEKEVQKTAEQSERETRIRREANTKTFDLPLTSYRDKLKDDMHIIARALELPDEGIKAAILLDNIRSHFKQYPELQHEPRFSGLFSNKRRRINPNSSTSNQRSQNISDEVSQLPWQLHYTSVLAGPSNGLTPHCYIPSSHLRLNYNFAAYNHPHHIATSSDHGL
jgi:hypothetical protein